MLKFYRVLVATCLLFPAIALADAGDSLRQLLQPLSSLKGSFALKQYDSDGELLKDDSGEFMLKRPGQFYWHTLEPFEEQLISDGKTLWLYEPDLEQVRVRKIGADEQSPALLLTGDSAKLAEQYLIVEQRTGARRRFELTPKQAGGMFEQLQIEFENSLPVLLSLTDGLGQKTRFELQVAATNIELADTLFRFAVPEGAEVITE